MYGIQWPLLMAGSVVLILPMLIVFILGQRFFVEGTYLGSVKG
jgi:multiple sugar transport system permease protein